MNISDYILTDLQTFQTSTLISTALENTQKQLFTHIIITENTKFANCIPIKDLDTIEEKSSNISDFAYLAEFFYANEDDTLFDLLNLFSRNESNILPVINAEHTYVGYYDLNDVLHCFAEAPFFNEEGLVLIIEKPTNNFTFSEITQIIESNNAKTLGLFVSSISETNTQITVKVTSENVNELIQSFRRHDFMIVSNHKDDDYIEDLKNRSNYLQKYLNL